MIQNKSLYIMNYIEYCIPLSVEMRICSVNLLMYLYIFHQGLMTFIIIVVNYENNPTE